MPPIRFSVITVCLNSKSMIGPTIESVQAQTHRHLEHLIQDGASTDGTLDVARRLTDERAKIISEKDGGIYNAMNKAIDRATGDVLYFLNAGDQLFATDILAEVARVFESGADFVYGDIAEPTTVTHYPEITKAYLWRGMIAHQCAFFRRSLFTELHRYDERYRICADFDHLLTVFEASAVVKRHIPRTIALFDRSGISSTDRVRLFEERRRIIAEHYNAFDRTRGLLYWSRRAIERRLRSVTG